MLCEFKDINYTISAGSYDVLAENLLILGSGSSFATFLRMFCQSLSMAHLSLDYTDNADTAPCVEPFRVQPSCSSLVIDNLCVYPIADDI